VTPPEGPPENELNPMLGLGSGMGGIMPFFTHTPQTSKRPTKTKPKKGEGVEEEKSENLTLVALGYTEDTSATPGPAVDYTTGEPDYKFKGKKGQKVENLGCRT